MNIKNKYHDVICNFDYVLVEDDDTKSNGLYGVYNIQNSMMLMIDDSDVLETLCKILKASEHQILTWEEFLKIPKNYVPPDNIWD